MSQNIDREIARALSEDDAALLEEFSGDLSPIGMMTETFRTRNAWLVGLVWFWTLVIFIFGIFCGVKMFQATELRLTILWGVGLVLAFHAVSMLKMWYFMEMHRVTIAREIKRLELQAARLSKKLDGSQEAG